MENNLEAWFQKGVNVEMEETNKLSASDRRILQTHSVGEAVVRVHSHLLFLRSLFETTGLAMATGGTYDTLVNLEVHDANAGDDSKDSGLTFSPANEAYAERSSAEDDEKETEGADTT